MQTTALLILFVLGKGLLQPPPPSTPNSTFVHNFFCGYKEVSKLREDLTSLGIPS